MEEPDWGEDQVDASLLNSNQILSAIRLAYEPAYYQFITKLESIKPDSKTEIQMGIWLLEELDPFVRFNEEVLYLYEKSIDIKNPQIVYFPELCEEICLRYPWFGVLLEMASSLNTQLFREDASEGFLIKTMSNHVLSSIIDRYDSTLLANYPKNLSTELKQSRQKEEVLIKNLIFEITSKLQIDM